MNSISEIRVLLMLKLLHCPRPCHRCGGFCLQCLITFSHSQRMDSSDGSKIFLMIEALCGRVLQSAKVYKSDYQSVYFQNSFLTSAKYSITSYMRRKNLTLENCSVVEFSIDFCILDVEIVWNKKALKVVFVNYLSKQLKD